MKNSYCHIVIAGQDKIEYRVWNPFRSKLAAAILGGVDQIHMPPGSKVLYLGAASGTTVSHVSDVVGPVSCAKEMYKYFHCINYAASFQEGLVYAVAAPFPGRDLIVLAQKRTNIVPIIEDARFPFKYSMLVMIHSEINFNESLFNFDYLNIDQNGGHHFRRCGSGRSGSYCRLERSALPQG